MFKDIFKLSSKIIQKSFNLIQFFHNKYFIIRSRLNFLSFEFFNFSEFYEFKVYVNLKIIVDLKMINFSINRHLIIFLYGIC